MSASSSSFSKKVPNNEKPGLIGCIMSFLERLISTEMQIKERLEDMKRQILEEQSDKACKTLELNTMCFTDFMGAIKFLTEDQCRDIDHKVKINELIITVDSAIKKKNHGIAMLALI